MYGLLNSILPYNSNTAALFRMNEFNFRVNGTFV